MKETNEDREIREEAQRLLKEDSDRMRKYIKNLESRTEGGQR